jgi:sterol desaturase/sphingolipid hydroxylase (fatty acid hydroxylase superfamily)
MALVAGVTFALVLMWAERRHPLRARTQSPGIRRTGRNLVLGTTGVLVSSAVEWLVVVRVGGWAERHRAGILRRLPLSGRVRAMAGFLLLDYTLFLWHWLNHRVPSLWRFHLVHHVDRDLDASTGVRFHFGELALTAGVRVVQVLVLGVDRRTLTWWQRCLTVSVLFHHSNVRVPLRLERALGGIVMTPRLHGIHHSERRVDTDSNYASLLVWWDLLHGTRRAHMLQEAVTIGVPAWRDASRLVLPALLAMPFRAQRDDWLEGQRAPLPAAARATDALPVAATRRARLGSTSDA